MNTQVNIVPTMEGVTTAIVAFLFVCLVFPGIVKNRPQYYAALATVIGIILLHTLCVMIGSAAVQVFGGVATGVLQSVAILLLVLCVGGLSVRQLADDLKGAYEVVRRGEEEKEVIIPLRGGGGGAGRPEDKPPVYVIDPETGDDKRIT